MQPTDSTAEWQSLEKQLDALLDLPEKERLARLAELDQSEPDHAHALRQWLADIERAEHDPLAQTHDGERVGPWRALHRLGRGGMGDVWMAERNDGTYQKRVAIKFLYGDSPQLRVRLEMERHLLAQLQHPNIPRLIDGGVTAGGQPYLVTDFVEGMPLDKWCLIHETADFDTRMRLFRQIASAVAHAHEHSVVHRDIKPNNVLVDRDGCAYLLDFGVARLLDEERRADTLQPLTLEYAAPEQIRSGTASVRTDIYGLGGLFYFLIAAKPPFDFHNMSIAACVKRIGEDVPAGPSTTSAAPGLPRELADDLDAIALKALAKSPDDRYANVDGLLQDLDNAFAHRPIEARKLDGGLYRARRFVRRNGLALGVSAAIVVSLAAGLVLALWQAHLASEQHDAAQAARANAEAERAASWEQSQPKIGAILCVRPFMPKELQKHRKPMPDQGMGFVQNTGGLFRFGSSVFQAPQVSGRCRALPSPRAAPRAKGASGRHGCCCPWGQSRKDTPRPRGSSRCRPLRRALRRVSPCRAWYRGR